MVKFKASSRSTSRLLVFFLFLVSALCGDAPSKERVGDQSAMQTLIVGCLGVLLLYFIVLRPDQKKRGELQKKRQDLKVGDVVLASAISGTVVQLDGDRVALRLQGDARVEVPRIAVFEVEPSQRQSARE